ncbi:hypothetical protein JSE7799_00677 [Jannaschia seosinensis]|uniref:Uncharacterized protein n=2 Tax=Jannaschia seosinensis TaxID=313367 RepID=A0A0M7B844_9RHOB|nr:hypothetical protein JSE7799_00677 [Jannaschia seosinensis]
MSAPREKTMASEGALLRDPALRIDIAIGQISAGLPLSPQARRVTVKMTNLSAINAAVPHAIPEGMIGAIVTPRSDLVEGDRVAATREYLVTCAD